jgi:hypothetical protein
VTGRLAVTARRAARSAASTVPLLSEFRLARSDQPLTNRWSQLPVASAGDTALGVSFRPLQAQALGLDPAAALAELLAYPFQIVRLAAYWNQLEQRPGAGGFGPLDEHVSLAARAGKKIIVCVGAVKAFGYPEFFVPDHYLPKPLPARRLVTPQTHGPLLEAAVSFVTRVVERYRERPEIVGWQVEHEAVDPLGLEQSWRLSESFVRREVAAVRAADPSRPVVLNGFLPTSIPVRLQQHWRTRDQGDSLAVAIRLADIVGLDYYPRHGLVGLGRKTAYLAGGDSRWQARANAGYCRHAVAAGRRLMVAEGQAEPWETVTTPPSLAGRGMFSCLPEHVIENFNSAMRLGRNVPDGLWAYLFWGAEYWLKRRDQGDGRYLAAFARVLAATADGTTVT